MAAKQPQRPDDPASNKANRSKQDTPTPIESDTDNEVQAEVEDRPIFARRVRAARKARGLSQNALARQTGLSTTYIFQLERGEMRNPKIETTTQLAEALGVSMAWLMGLDEQERTTGTMDVTEEQQLSDMEAAVEHLYRANPNMHRAEVEAWIAGWNELNEQGRRLLLAMIKAAVEEQRGRGGEDAPNHSASMFLRRSMCPPF